MLRRCRLYWRWLRIKRVKVGRFIQLDLPRFSRMSEYAAGDNFPVLDRAFARAE